MKLSDEELAQLRALDLQPQHIKARLFAIIDALAAELSQAQAELAAMRAGVIQHAIAEYGLNHARETDEERRGRRNAVRGMMVRAGMYEGFTALIGDDAAAPQPPARRHATIVDGCLVHGDAPLSPEGREAVSTLISAVRAKHAEAQPPAQPVAVVATDVVHDAGKM